MSLDTDGSGIIMYEIFYNVSDYLKNQSKVALLWFDATHEMGGTGWGGSDEDFNYATLDIMNQTEGDWTNPITIKTDYSIWGDLSFSEMMYDMLQYNDDVIGGDGMVSLRMAFNTSSANTMYMSGMSLYIGELPTYILNQTSTTIQDTSYDSDLWILDSDITFINVTFNGHVGVDPSTVNFTNCDFYYPIHIASSYYADNSSVIIQNSTSYYYSNSIFDEPGENFNYNPNWNCSLYVAGKADVDIFDSKFYDQAYFIEKATVDAWFTEFHDGITVADNATVYIKNFALLNTTKLGQDVIMIGQGYNTIRIDDDTSLNPSLFINDTNIIIENDIEIGLGSYVNMYNTNSTGPGWVATNKDILLEMEDCDFSGTPLHKSIYDMDGDVTLTSGTAIGTYNDGIVLTNTNFALQEVDKVYFGDEMEDVGTLTITDEIMLDRLEAGNHGLVYVKNSSISDIQAYHNATIVLIESTYNYITANYNWDMMSIFNPLILNISSESSDPDNVQGTVNITVVDAQVGPEGNVNNTELFVDSVPVASYGAIPHNYSWDSTSVNNGLRNMRIDVTDDYSYTYQHNFQLNINNPQNSTDLFNTTVIDVEVVMGENATYRVYFNDTTNALPVTGATIDTNWTYGWLTTNYANGSYKVELVNTSLSGIGMYLINFTAQESGYETQILQVTLNVTALPVNNTNLVDVIPGIGYTEIVRNEEQNLTVYYNNTDYALGISGAIITTNWTGDWTPTDFANGNYNITVNANVLVGIYVIEIKANKTGYQDAYQYIMINVTGTSDMIIQQDNIYAATNLDFNQNATIRIFLNDSGSGVEGATIEWLGYSGTWQEESGGYYNITFDMLQFANPGYYFVNISANKIGYNNGTGYAYFTHQLNMTSTYTSTPTIDGQGDGSSTKLIDSNEWANSIRHFYIFDFNYSSDINDVWNVTVLLLNDDIYLYVGYEYPDTSGWEMGHPSNESDGFATWTNMDYTNVSTHAIWDFHGIFGNVVTDTFINDTDYQTFNDTDFGGTNDTVASNNWYSLTSIVELRMPFNSTDLYDHDNLTTGIITPFKLYTQFRKIMLQLDKFEYGIYSNGYVPVIDGYLDLGSAPGQMEILQDQSTLTFMDLGQNVTVRFLLNDTETGFGVANANISWLNYNQATLQEEGAGWYNITFNESLYTDYGYYFVNMSVNKTDYNDLESFICFEFLYDITSLYTDTPPTIDGQGDGGVPHLLDSVEWSNAANHNYSLFLQDASAFGTIYNFTMLFMNDGDYLYLGLQFDDLNGWNWTGTWTDSDMFISITDLWNESSG